VSSVDGETAEQLVERLNYLRGAAWQRAQWVPEGTWDHEHCAVCWAKFDAVGGRDSGLATAGPAGRSPADQRPGYYWLCPECFDRHAQLFGWVEA
jgi:hypothetical protein